MKSPKTYFDLTLIIIYLIAFVWYLPVYSVQSYQPEIEDPLLEKWRWVKFPELSNRGVRCMTEDYTNKMWFGLDHGVINYDGYQWQEYNETNGFSNAAVRALFCGEDEKIYAGSDSGLYVYDGSVWHNIIPPLLNTDIIFNKILQLEKDNIFCATNLGLIQIQALTIKIYTSQQSGSVWQRAGFAVHLLDMQFLVNNEFHVADIFVTGDRQLWLATGYDNGTSGKIITVKTDAKKTSDLDFKVIFRENDSHRFYNGAKIIQKKDNQIWIINNQHDRGLLKYSESKFKRFNLGNRFGEDEIHTSIEETDDGTLFLGGLGKLYKFEKNIWQLFRSPQIPIPSSTCILIFESADGSIWIAGRQNEVYKLDYSNKTWATYRHLNFEGESADETYWFISLDGRVVSRKDNNWKSFGEEDGLIEAPVRIFITRKNEIWVAGSHRGIAATAYLSSGKWIRQLHPQLSWNIDFRAVFEDHSGNLWFGGNIDVDVDKGQNAGTALLLNPSANKTDFVYYPSRQKEPGAYGLGQSKDGQMWMGGIGTCTIQEDEWKVVEKPEQLQYHTDYLCSDAAGNLWVGSRYYGVFHHDGISWKNYTIADGLVSNSVTYILPESNECIWVAADKGISKFDGQSWTNHIFPDELTIVREGGSLRKTKAGGIWINKTSREWNRRMLGGKKALTKKMKEYRTVFYQPDILPPKTSITLYDEQVYQPGNTLISWAGLDTWARTPTQKLQYSYRMDERSWSPFSYQTNNIFLSLPDGVHRFDVRARDLDYNIDPIPATVEFNVAPPFYRHPLFYIPMLLLTVIIVLLQIRVKRRGKKLRASKRETDNILYNVDEGLMLINSECIIGNQYSTVLEKIFEESSLAQMNLLDILQEKIDDEQLKTTKDFLELLFKENYNQSMMDDLNPLSEVSLTFLDQNRVKSLAFNFRNIDTGYGNEKEVMVTVKDITEQINLEKRLKESKQDAKRQMNWLVNILHVDPPLLQEFILSANEEVVKVEKLLAEGHDSKNRVEILKTIYRSIHLIKGNASLLALKAFSEQAHEFEEKIHQIQNKENIDDKDLKSLSYDLLNIKKTLDEVNTLLKRIGKIHEQMRPRRSYEHKVMIQSFENLVSQLSEEQDKSIRLETKDFKIEEIPHKDRIFTKEIMVQLIRNSVAHGIEDATLREENNKPKEAEIIIETGSNSDYFSFSVRDDGQGIQIERLRKRVEKSGKWDLREIADRDDKKVTELIYEHGISTNENSDLISGRGVGLDLVKEKVRSKNGIIDLDFDTGKYCQFNIKVPKKS